MLDFIYTQYIFPQKLRFSDITRGTSENYSFLSYFVLNSKKNKILKVKLFTDKKIQVEITPLFPVSDSIIEEARQDIVISIQMFEERIRKYTWYFAWREGETIIPEKIKYKTKSFHRLLLETQVLLFTTFIGLGMILFIFIAIYYPAYFWIAPLILILGQFIVVFHSNKIIAKVGDWNITKNNPVIHFLEYRLPINMIDTFKGTTPEQLANLKKEIYEEIKRKNGKIDCELAHEIFIKYGIPCKKENLTAKKINVYELVEKVVKKFGYRIPKIVVSNTMVPNAAASGPSPSRGIILITTGLLVQLEKEEVESVLGHELGHLKGRDPLILYGLTSGEFLFRFYIIFTFYPIVFITILFFVYFWAVMTLIFFIAKFLEARADLVSAIVIGKPKHLASALEKIGFQKLLFERTTSYRIQQWLGLGSHPPIYFRVARLKKLEEPVRVKFPLIHSIKDVINGLFASIRKF